MMKTEAYCEWHDKPLRNVFEHEMEECRGECDKCGCLIYKEKEEE